MMAPMFFHTFFPGPRVFLCVFFVVVFFVVFSSSSFLRGVWVW